MNHYTEQAKDQLQFWQKKMIQKPSLTNRMSKGLQRKINGLIPEKVHAVVTETIKNIVKAVLFGNEFITKEPLAGAFLEEREKLVKGSISFYKKAAMAEGAWTGAGGLLLAIADFPLLLSLKMKLLFETAATYGFNVREFKERLFILHIFELAFSSQERTTEIYHKILNWDTYVKSLPDDINQFDWRSFQQEYRDYLDLAKLLQMVPGIGAFIGAFANYKLMDKLGETAMNAYRLRIFRMSDADFF